ncbi:2Fe-2S iron-sulfur cluster-binding protein [Pseudomonas graminis]|uniref:2Fe-2S iron-sulfur cluster-binding protein n=1 Tax=Pseudomonas graminis TaxID=158627 RepID=UPI003266B67B
MHTAPTRPAYACRTGACLSCAGKIIQGSVDQSDQSYLTPNQLSANYVLLCVACPMKCVQSPSEFEIA